MKDWCLVNGEGKVVRVASSTRPSGPVMGNAEAARGNRWVPKAEVDPAKSYGFKDEDED